MGPIFNIFFINKVAVGPINSTATVPLQCYLSPPFCKTREMKKKKKMKKRRRQTQVSAESKRHLSDCLDKAEKASESASSIFLFFMHVFLGRRQDYCSRAQSYLLCTVYTLLTHNSWDPQPLYSEKNIKNVFHNAIYTFKNYFVTEFSIFYK